MKILIVNWQDPDNPQAGGAEIHLREIFSRLAGAGHEVTWLASGWPGARSVEQTGDFEVHRTGSRYTFGIRAIPYYRSHLAARRFDVVVEALNKVPTFAPLWAGRPVVLIVHHLFGATAFREASLPVATLTWLLERPIPRVYSAVPVEAISESTRNDLVARGLPAAHVAVIRPGVDLQFFHPDPSTARLEPPTFLYIGRLRRYKSVDLILRALARVRAEGIDARLIVAGKGDDEVRLRRITSDLRLDDAVEFTGYVSEERKRELLRRTWANVFVSPKEGWGITNLEAAACGTPTIASDSPGLRESVDRDRSGVLVPHGDVDSLAGAMRRFATDPDFVARLGAQALDFARDFTWERTAAETERHLGTAVARSFAAHPDPDTAGR